MLDKLRLFLVVLEEGSLRRAADRLRISQPAITRQIQSLELELGGRVLERTSTGVRATGSGQVLAQKAQALLADFDSAMTEIRRLNRRESDLLRIGYMASAIQEYLGLSLAALRLSHPKLKIKMLDLTPAEMIGALRQNEIDLALTCYGIELLSRDFYARKLATVGSLATLPVNHPLATAGKVFLSQLKDETFISGDDEVVPGYNQKIISLCRKHGGFRPRLAVIDKAAGLVESLALAANDETISIQPDFISHLNIPNVSLVPVADAGAIWDVSIVWRAAGISSALKALLNELNLKSP